MEGRMVQARKRSSKRAGLDRLERERERADDTHAKPLADSIRHDRCLKTLVKSSKTILS